MTAEDTAKTRTPISVRPILNRFSRLPVTAEMAALSPRRATEKQRDLLPLSHTASGN